MDQESIYRQYIVGLADGKDYLLYNKGQYDRIACRYIKNRFTVKTTKQVINEDWKTAIAHNQPAIPENTELIVDDVILNFYGKFITTEYNGYYYYLNPKDLFYVKGEKVEEY